MLDVLDILSLVINKMLHPSKYCSQKPLTLKSHMEMGLAIVHVPSGGNAYENTGGKNSASHSRLCISSFSPFFLSRRATLWILCGCWNTPLIFTTISIIHSVFGVPRVCLGMLHKWTFFCSCNCKKSIFPPGFYQTSECGSLLIFTCDICRFPADIDAEHPTTCIHPPPKKHQIAF